MICRFIYRILYCCCAIGPFVGVQAQNLVLNPGFEDYSTCPGFIDQLNRATHWTKPTPGTADYFNSCTTFPGVNTPDNGFGSETPYDGQAYAGFVAYVDSSVYGGFAHYREYLSGTLSEGLQAGKYYSVEFMVSVAEQYRYGSNNLGVFFTDSIPDWSGSPTSYPALSQAPYFWEPQVEYRGTPISLADGWMSVSGEYQAEGGEIEFVIGNFRDDHSTDRVDVHPWASAMAYYFIDAVSVERLYYPPVAMPDSGVTTGSTPVLLAVLDNDSDMDGFLDPSSLMLISAPAFGSVNLELATGEILYTAFEGASGTDLFYYRICDEEGLCDSTWVQIRVEAPQLNGPIAVDDLVSTNWNQPVSIDLLANDSGGSSALVPGSLVLYGWIEPMEFSLDTAMGRLTFLPSPDFCGEASLSYLICNQDELCDSAAIFLTVNCLEPLCLDDSYTIEIGQEKNLSILSNDRPGNGNWDLQSLILRSEPLLGDVSLLEDGSLLYRSREADGLDRFRYEICDQAGLCDQAWVEVRVNAGFALPQKPELFIPDIITPNGDGFNDQWVILGLNDFDTHEIRLINRWDSEVFRTDQYQQNWSGEQLPDGTYFYLIRVGKGQQQWVYKGALTLLR